MKSNAFVMIKHFNSLCLGAFFGVLRSKIFATRTKTGLHYFFYGFSIIVFLASITSGFIYWSDFSLFGIIGSVLAIFSSIALFIFTKRYLLVKDVYHTSELDHIVNSFTANGDKNEIKMFGGDLNFFGNTPSDMDNNAQYHYLRSLEFNKISILCEEPNDNTKKIRYGKILHDMPETELRFYNPKEADLKVRGRMIKVQGSDKLLMYTRVKSKHYQALETDTGNSGGALYNNIWNLVWSLAVKPTPPQLQDYKNLFSNR